MEITSLKTRVFRPQENLVDFVRDYAGKKIIEKDILLVTSKIVSLSEGQLVKNTNQDKELLVKEESDHFLGRIGYDCFLTVKHGLLIPSAGIDESNSEQGDYILFPKDPYKSARSLCNALKKQLGLKDLGIILTDSHTTPLRRGVLGVALSYWGFKGLSNKVDEEDLFGRKLKMTQQNVVDALAVSGVALMGEGAESCPLALIRKAPVEFCEEDRSSEMAIPLTEDLYYPLYENLLK